MNPAVIASELCAARGGNFREEVEAHMLNGYLYAGADAFIMGRPLPRSADVADLWTTYPLEECDAWYVWTAVGRVTRLFELLPFELPWIGWYRQTHRTGMLHWQPTAEIRARLIRFSGWLDKTNGLGAVQYKAN